MKELKMVVFFSKCIGKEWDEALEKCLNIKFETHKKRWRRVYESKGPRVREKYWGMYRNLTNLIQK